MLDFHFERKYKIYLWQIPHSKEDFCFHRPPPCGSSPVFFSLFLPVEFRESNDCNFVLEKGGEGKEDNLWL